MANISSYNQLSSWNEDDDLLFVQQPDAPKKAHPSQMKQYVLGDMDDAPTSGSSKPVKSGGVKTYVDNAVSSNSSTTNSITISRMGKVRVLSFNRAVYPDIKNFFNNLSSADKPNNIRFSTVMRNSSEHQYMTLAFIYANQTGIWIKHFAQYNTNIEEGEIEITDRVIGEFVYIVD